MNSPTFSLNVMISKNQHERLYHPCAKVFHKKLSIYTIHSYLRIYPRWNNFLRRAGNVSHRRTAQV